MIPSDDRSESTQLPSGKIEEVEATNIEAKSSVDVAKTKDWWDKAAIIISLVSGVVVVLLVAVGGLYYKAQEVRWKEQEDSMRKLQHQLQSRGIEVDAALKLLPYLADSDLKKQEAAFRLLKHYASIETVFELAKVYEGTGVVHVLQDIALSRDPSAVQQAFSAVDILAQILVKEPRCMATVSWSDGEGGDLSLFGVFVSPRGHLIAYAPERILGSSPRQQIHVLQMPRFPLNARLLAVDNDHNLVLIKVDAETPCLKLAAAPPAINNNILIASSPRHIKSNPWAVATVLGSSDLAAYYSRPLGWNLEAGAAVIDEKGRLAGIMLIPETESTETQLRGGGFLNTTILRSFLMANNVPLD